MNLKLAKILNSIPEDFVQSRVLRDSITFSKEGASFASTETITVSWYCDGEPFALAFRKGGYFHRVDGPARLLWLEDGKIFREEWYLNGSYHRKQSDGPAIIHWDENGQKTVETYVEHNMSVRFSF